MTGVDHLRGQLQARRKAPAAPAWHPPQLSDFQPYTTVLAFDATLSHCGWVLMTAGLERIEIHDKGTINISTELTSYLGTWEKARQLKERLGRIYVCASGRTNRIALEAPLAAGVGSRSESSLIAGMLVVMRHEKTHHVQVVSASHVSAVLLGDHKVKSAERKKRIRAEVIRLIPEAAGRSWNEHERDGAATGLTDLYDLRQAQMGAA